MPVFRNENKHGVNPSGSQRVPAGQAVEVSDEDAKSYRSLGGLTELRGQEAKDATRAQEEEQSSVPSRRERQNQRIRELRIESRGQAVVAPLQRVVGDNEAPYGPPTGEVSTKVDEAQKDLAHRIAFADHEALEPVDEPDEPLTPHSVVKSQVIHNRQHEALLEAQPDLSEEGAGAEPQSQGKPQQSSGSTSAA
jgi:hypothetical protein